MRISGFKPRVEHWQYPGQINTTFCPSKRFRGLRVLSLCNGFIKDSLKTNKSGKGFRTLYLHFKITFRKLNYRGGEKGLSYAKLSVEVSQSDFETEFDHFPKR